MERRSPLTHICIFWHVPLMRHPSPTLSIIDDSAVRHELTEFCHVRQQPGVRSHPCSMRRIICGIVRNRHHVCSPVGLRVDFGSKLDSHCKCTSWFCRDRALALQWSGLVDINRYLRRLEPFSVYQSDRDAIQRHMSRCAHFWSHLRRK